MKNLAVLQYKTDDGSEKSNDFSSYRDQVRELLRVNGAVLMRGFPVCSQEDFRRIISNDLGFEPWFLARGPSSFLSWRRKFQTEVIQKGDYRLITDSKSMMLGPAEHSIQGPHIESGLYKVRPKYIAMYCEKTSPGTADTGLYDTNKAFESLPEDDRIKYLNAWNVYKFFTKPLGKIKQLLARILFSGNTNIYNESSRTLVFETSVPLVCIHPDKNIPCIQTWPFHNNTAMAVYKAAKESFPERKNIKGPDHTAISGRGEWLLASKEGDPIEWSDEEQFRLFKNIYDHRIALTWEKGDILIVDNIHFAHGRLEDNNGGERHIHQILLNAFDSTKNTP